LVEARLVSVSACGTGYQSACCGDELAEGNRSECIGADACPAKRDHATINDLETRHVFDRWILQRCKHVRHRLKHTGSGATMHECVIATGMLNRGTLNRPRERRTADRSWIEYSQERIKSKIRFRRAASCGILKGRAATLGS